jgi:RNA-directed DNA polymerase
VKVGKTNASEPPMTCRKVSRRHRNRDRWLTREKLRRGPADDLGGVRHEGGVSPIQALLRNVGTCRPDAKGTPQVGGPHEGLGTDAGHRGGVPRSSGEADESRWSEGGTSTSTERRPTGNRRSR